MPIEIRELVIKASVTPAAPAPLAAAAIAQLRQEVIAACMERVLEHLSRADQR
ncbi:MAG: DUF5908 family protein [Pseudomonadota bacterium]|jgi:hypothetical protein